MNPYKRNQWHETQPQKESLPEEPYADPHLQSLHRAEGGAGLKRVSLHQLPKWLQIFGYCLIAFLMIEGLFGLYETFHH